MEAPAPTGNNLVGIAKRMLAAWRREFTPAARLAALAAASAAIYGLALARPYSLLKWVDGPRQTLGTITNKDPLKGLAFVAVFVAAYLLYGLALRTVQDRSTRKLWIIVSGGMLAFSLIFMLLYPFGAADIFDNIIRGRIQTRYGGNPFYQIPADFSSDALYKYAYWEKATSAYGPLWEIVAAAGAAVAGDTVLGNIMVFKGISVIAYLVTALVIARGLQRHAPRRALYGVIFYAWNPLVLYTVAGDAHNDALMVLFAILGFVLLARRRYLLAGLAEVAGTLVKFIPALLLPIIVLATLKAIPGLKPRLRYLSVMASASAMLVVGAYAPYWHGGDVLSVGRRTTLFTTSAPTLIRNVLANFLAQSTAQQITAYVALGIVCVGLLGQMIALWRSDSADAPLQAGLNVLLIYLLIACLWFQPWYVIWPLGLAALLPNRLSTRGTLLLSVFAMFKFSIFHFVLVSDYPLVPLRTQREWWLTMLTLGPVWLFFCLYFVRGWWSHRAAGRHIERTL